MTVMLDRPAAVPAPRTAGRHRRPEPAEPVAPLAPVEERRDTRLELTQPMPAVFPGARVLLPFPEQAGQVIRHPATGALAVSCNSPGFPTPRGDKVPCYALIRGAELHRDRTGRAPLWLTYNEAVRAGWRVAGHL